MTFFCGLAADILLVRKDVYAPAPQYGFTMIFGCLAAVDHRHMALS